MAYHGIPFQCSMIRAALNGNNISFYSTLNTCCRIPLYLFVAAASETISPVNTFLQLVEYSRTLREYYRAHGIFSSEVSTLVICLNSIF